MFAQDRPANFIRNMVTWSDRTEDESNVLYQVEGQNEQNYNLILPLYAVLLQFRLTANLYVSEGSPSVYSVGLLMLAMCRRVPVLHGIVMRKAICYS